MLRAVKIRLYPNKEQATMFNKLLGCYRVVYNQCLSRKIKSYEEAIVASNWICSKLDNKYDSANN